MPAGFFMPELPEVETTRRGIEPAVAGRRVEKVIVREQRLRWPIPRELPHELPGRVFDQVGRRGKYLLLGTGDRSLIIHLGMSGRLSVVTEDLAPTRHDHLDILLAGGNRLRLNDPRRFGSVFWWAGDPLNHPRLAGLGPEPLSGHFTPQYLYTMARGRRAPVKAFLMDARVVVGAGNIYATEALFMAGIHPRRPAGRIALTRYAELHAALRAVLKDAITRGGTTLRDYVGADGRPGFFQLDLRAYGRTGEPCKRCGHTLRTERIGQRASVFCPRCQR